MIAMKKVNGPLPELTPAELILARVQAFARNDFAFVFHTYHPDAPFLQIFPDRESYLEYAARELQGRIVIVRCLIGRQRVVSEDEVEVLLQQEIRSLEGHPQETVELVRLRRTAMGWRYHSAARRLLTDFDKALESIDFEDFLRLGPPLFF
jgi:SEC-C motif-containing protein